MKTDKKDLYPPIIVSDKVKSRANDPYVVKKAEHAKEMLRLRGIPDQFKTKK